MESVFVVLLLKLGDWGLFGAPVELVELFFCFRASVGSCGVGVSCAPVELRDWGLFCAPVELVESSVFRVWLRT